MVVTFEDAYSWVISDVCTFESLEKFSRWTDLNKISFDEFRCVIKDQKITLSAFGLLLKCVEVVEYDTSWLFMDDNIYHKYADNIDKMFRNTRISRGLSASTLTN